MSKNSEEITETQALGISEYDNITSEDLGRLWKTFVRANDPKRYGVLKTFVYRRLRPEDDSIIDIEYELIERLLDDTNILEWEKIFYHKTYNEELNYEKYEAIGDVYLSCVFVSLLNSKFEDELKTPKQIQLTKAGFMSKEKQSSLGREMGFHLMLISSRINIKDVMEDMFEAFFGALGVLLDDIESGLGFKYIKRYLDYLLPDIRVINEADPVTRLKERFELLARYIPGLETPKEKRVLLEDGTKVHYYYYTNLRPKYAESIGDIDQDKKLKLISAELALKQADEDGFTMEKVFEYKAIKDLEDESYRKAHNDMKKALKKFAEKVSNEVEDVVGPYGYTIDVLTVPDGYNAYLHLFTKDKNGSVHVNRNVTHAHADTQIKAKIEVIRKFINTYG